jgi:hypothetical protein
MNRRMIFIVAGLAALGPAPAPGQTDSRQLSPERLDALDRLGCFTPGFKAAAHDLVDSKDALEQARTEQELAKYEHPEETDFTALQMRMNDAGAKLEDQIAPAQAYVWTYPASPHESEAQQYLQQAQKKLADQRQAEKDAEAAREAAHAKLVQRAQARDLSLGEWRDFLRGMSQDDLVKLLGRPASTSQEGNDWIYAGAWILDPTTHQKVGMEINFNAGRVLSLDEKPPPP